MQESNWIDLSGRCCVVSGAAGGIGAATASELAACGASLFLLDRAAETVEEVAATLRARGAQAHALACDVASPAAVEAAAAACIHAFGRCDVLVNNAGVLRPGGLDTLSPDDWRGVMAVNLDGYFLCSQAFGRAMLERGRGAIVHVGSIAGSEPQAFSGAYSASKSALAMLSRQLAFEWGPRGVRSNVVSPGLVRTPMSESFYRDARTREAREGVVPCRRIGAPQDIANAIAFLASERAAYVNGQEVVVDGGFAQTLMSHVPRPGYD